MKKGQHVFFSCAGDVSCYAEVIAVTETQIQFSVINGGYTLTLHAVEPPEMSRDYNSVMAWYRREFLK